MGFKSGVNKVKKSKEEKEVLIVDDEFISNLILEKNLEEFSGLKINTFDNATELKEYLLANRDKEIEYLFLDLNMPIVSGFDFLDWYDKNPTHKNLNIYILSSTVLKKDVERSTQYKYVKEFIGKPITKSPLEAIFKNIAA